MLKRSQFQYFSKICKLKKNWLKMEPKPSNVLPMLANVSTFDKNKNFTFFKLPCENVCTI